MFFSKKDKKELRCENCGSFTEKKHSFCPHCGNNFRNTIKEKKDYGLLGKNDFADEEIPIVPNLTITDKLISSMFNSLMKNLDKQFKEQFKDIDKELDDAEIRTLPNGIRIKISGPFYSKPRNGKQNRNFGKPNLAPQTLKKMSALPREQAKTSVKRLGNRIVYELSTPGVSSVEDIFISKLESGYEVKAIGDKKVYVNSIPINLPIKKYSIIKNKLSVEFLSSYGQ